MKSILKFFVFSYIALYLTHGVINALIFGGDYLITMFLVLVALTLVNLFMPAIIGIVSLPTKGPGFLFLSFLMNLVVFYILTIVIPSFGVRATTVPELIIFGFVLPSKSLTSTSAIVFTTLLFVVILNFFTWLSASKK
jgi:hypothetical protein